MFNMLHFLLELITDENFVKFIKKHSINMLYLVLTLFTLRYSAYIGADNLKKINKNTDAIKECYLEAVKNKDNIVEIQTIQKHHQKSISDAFFILNNIQPRIVDISVDCKTAKIICGYVSENMKKQYK